MSCHTHGGMKCDLRRGMRDYCYYFFFFFFCLFYFFFVVLREVNVPAPNASSFILFCQSSDVFPWRLSASGICVNESESSGNKRRRRKKVAKTFKHSKVERFDTLL